METETALHILCECVGLAELGIRRLGKLFTKPSDYDTILLCKTLYFVRCMGLMAE
jgi:hypothetical protein